MFKKTKTKKNTQKNHVLDVILGVKPVHWELPAGPQHLQLGVGTG